MSFVRKVQKVVVVVRFKADFFKGGPRLMGGMPSVGGLSKGAYIYASFGENH